jgi:hypothetical protein
MVRALEGAPKEMTVMCCAAGYGPDHKATNFKMLPGELPVEPLWCREAVWLLVPVKEATLRRWISRNGNKLSPPQYTGPKTRRRRLFTSNDIKVLRAALVYR